MALGGLFDGILLHQVLQWHHLLSLVGDESLQDLRTQVLADGLFHILMYAIGCLGLWLLWSGGRSITAPKSSALLGVTLLGFGVWQFLDVVLFHWVLRIHRIRVDVPNPLIWDIGWMTVFGLPALAAAYWLLVARRTGRAGASPRRAPAALSVMMVMAAAISMVPPAGANTIVVLFADAVTREHAFSAIAASGAEIVWMHESGLVAALKVGPDASRAPLYRSGAVLVGATAVPCLAWSKT